MNIFEILKRDHEKVLSIFEELDEASGEVSRKQDARQDKLFTRLKQELEVHLEGEEAVFYAELREEEDTRVLVLESYEEHHVVRVLLSELAGMPKDEYWIAKLSVLRENVKHHIAKEEDDVFEEAREVLSDEQAGDMGKRMAEFKKEQMTHK